MNALPSNHTLHPKTPTSESALTLALRLQREVAARRAAGAEMISPGEWLRRVGGLQAPFGFDRMPTVLG